MALEESVETYKELTADGLTAYIDPHLLAYVQQMGQIYIDYVARPDGRGAYSIMIGGDACSHGSCSSYGCG